MAKTAKATKKFNSKHLKHTLEQRNKVKAYKKMVGKRKKKGTASQPADKAKKNEVFKDLDTEKYFEKGFEPPKSKQSETAESAESAESSDSEMEMDQQDLDDLKKDDPEFYKYLEKNDEGLLDFEPMNPLDAIESDEEDEEGEGEEEKPEKEKKEKKSEAVEVTPEMVKGWEENLKSDEPSLNGIKNVVVAFKSAVNIETDTKYRYKVSRENVFNFLMVLVLKQLPLAIQKIVPYSTNKHGVRSLSKNKKVSQVSAILKVHSGSLVELLDGVKSTEMAALILQSIQELLPFFLSWRKILKKIVNSVVGLWCTAEEFDTQVAAFAFLNNAAKEYKKNLLEVILKAAYSGFIKHCRRTNAHTMASINFQKNSMTELFASDDKLGYQLGFENVRQLAVHLRGSVNTPTKDSYKAVYNWQFCHALDFWSRMLSQHASEEAADGPLKQLIYPLVQVTIGTIRLVPSAQFFPLRFYLIRSLLRLSQFTGVFIPIFPLLSEILTSSTFNRKPKGGKENEGLAAVDFENSIRVSSGYLGTRAYQQGLAEQFVELASEFYVLYCKNIAFPELVTPATIYLRRYKKKSVNGKFNRMLDTLVDKLNANSKYIEQQRATVSYGPSNKQEVAKFLQDVAWEKTPLGAYVKTQREVREAKLKMLRDAVEEAEKVQDKKEEKEEENDSDSE